MLAGGVLAQPATLGPEVRPEAAPEAPREASAEAPLGPEVVEVELHLMDEVRSDGLPEQVAVRKGQRLTVGAVRRSVEQLWMTGRFTDVVVREVALPEGGVRLVFQLWPAELLARLTVEGNRVLSDEALLEVSGLEEGGPLEQDGLAAARAAIEESYWRRGYEARVTVAREAEVGGVGLTLTVEEGLPTRLERLTVAGSPGLPWERLLEVLGVRPGEVLDRARLEEGQRRLRDLLRARGHYRARVEAPAITVKDYRATVALPVSAGPRFSFHFHGNHHMPSALLRALLAYDGAEPLDSEVALRLARRLASFYRYRGFHDVRVSPREVRSPDTSQAVLAFDISEGQPLWVREVRFRGNEALSTQALRELLTEQVRARQPRPELEVALPDDPLELEGRDRGPRRTSAPAPDPSTVYVEEAWLRAAEAMTEAYRERGYLSARVRLVGLRVEVEGRTAVGDFQVEEGPRAWVREVGFSGVPAGLDARAQVRVREGQPLSLEQVEDGRAALVRTLSRQGYLFARAEAEARTQEEGRGVRVLYTVDAGPRVQAGRLILQGLRRTEEETVLTHLGLEQGQALDMERLAAAQRRLVRLDIFRQAEVQLADPNRPEPHKDVLVRVQERPRMDGQVSGGYFLQDGPRISLDTSFANVDGRGLNLQARGKINYVGWSVDGLSGRYEGDEDMEGLKALGGRGNVAFALPRLPLPLDVGARVDLIGERVHRPSFVSTRYAAVGGLDWAAARWLSVALQYEVENNQLNTRGFGVASTREDLERLRFPRGTFLLHSLKPVATLDLRDDPANPRRGLLLATSAEFTNRLRPERVSLQEQDSAVDWVKLSGTLSVYAPLGTRASVALSARAGSVFPVTEGVRPIGSKLFYLGGSASLRGFREDGVLPEDQREQLRRQLVDCRALIHPLGCSRELEEVLGGRNPVSRGGEVFTLGKAELRLPASTTLDLGLFLEAGNLWAERTRFEPWRLRYVAGAGLRYVTPVGPLAFDVGFNLTQDDFINEPPAQFHFSIGAF